MSLWRRGYNYYYCRRRQLFLSSYIGRSGTTHFQFVAALFLFVSCYPQWEEPCAAHSTAACTPMPRPVLLLLLLLRWTVFGSCKNYLLRPAAAAAVLKAYYRLFRERNQNISATWFSSRDNIYLQIHKFFLWQVTRMHLSSPDMRWIDQIT